MEQGTFGDEEVQLPIDTPSEVAQVFFQKCFRGDLTAAVDLLDPKVSYRVPGSHRLAGTFEGPKAVAEHVEELLRQTHHTMDVLQWEDWMVGVNNLAGLVTVRVQRDARIATVRMILLVTMSRENKIERIEMFFSDQPEIDRFFA